MAGPPSTFQLPDSDPPCEVRLPYNLTQDQLLQFSAFRNWLKALRHNIALQHDKEHTFYAEPYKLRGIDVESATWFTPNMLGFVKIQATITTDKGGSDGWLPGAVFLRGRSVAMLIILQPTEGNETTEHEKYVILTVQPRIAATSFALAELPAGMLDKETANVKGKAVDEIREETGLEFDKKELIDMTELAVSQASKQLWKKSDAGTTSELIIQSSEPDELLQMEMYPSPGACDESISLFLCQKRLPQADLNELKGRLTGLRGEGEKITLKLVPLKDLWKEGARDAKALSALAIYEALNREGKLPSF